jgi:hypothetical protein
MKFPLWPFALTLLLVLRTGPAFADADPDELLRGSVERLGLQTEMPDPKFVLRNKSQESGLAPLTEPQQPKSGPQIEMPDPATRAPDDGSGSRTSPELNYWLLLGCVILGVIVIGWSLRDSLPGISRSRKIIAPEQAPPSLPPSPGLEEAQLEADDLARQGHYREAMHLLLLKGLNEIRRQLGTSFAISLTSREILRRLQLPDAGRQSLTAIIRSVELTYFGDEDAGQSDYSDCRSNFETLKHSLAIVAAR